MLEWVATECYATVQLTLNTQQINFTSVEEATTTLANLLTQFLCPSEETRLYNRECEKWDAFKLKLEANRIAETTAAGHEVKQPEPEPAGDYASNHDDADSDDGGTVVHLETDTGAQPKATKRRGVQPRAKFDGVYSNECRAFLKQRDRGPDVCGGKTLFSHLIVPDIWNLPPSEPVYERMLYWTRDHDVELVELYF